MIANSYEISRFICLECSHEFPLPRPKAKRRPKGHIKDLYCPFCGKKVKTMEVRAIDYDVYNYKY